MWSAQPAICGQRSGQAISWGQRDARPAQRGCERRKSRAVARSQAGAALSWTRERADMFFRLRASEEGSG
jgi:hypothetical protein